MYLYVSLLLFSRHLPSLLTPINASFHKQSIDGTVSFLEQQINLHFPEDTCLLTRGTLSLGYFPTLRWIIVASLHSKAIQETRLTPNMKT